MKRTALIAGSTGLVGQSCLQALLENPNYERVIALVRKPTAEKHSKLKQVICDFENLATLATCLQAQDIFCCLGTTIKVAGTRENFYKVDFTYVFELARLMKEQGAEQFIVVSAMGASKNSRVFYSQVKGEMETAIKDLGYRTVHILRPSLLLGDRREVRMGEKIAEKVTKVLNPLFVAGLKKYKPIEADKVGRFMVELGAQNLVGTYVYESDQIQI